MEIIFGDKKIFGIGVKQSGNDSKFYFRYYFNDIPIGDYKKKVSLISITSFYLSFFERVDTLYEEKFKDLSYRQIFDDILDCIDDSYSIEDQEIRLVRMKNFDFGLDVLGNSITLLVYKENRMMVFLVYKMDAVAKPKFYSFKVDFDYFTKVYEEFLQAML